VFFILNEILTDIGGLEKKGGVKNEFCKILEKYVARV